MNTPIFFGLPSAAELYDEPQRAILAALDANLVLTVRALQARHPDIHDNDPPYEPLPLLAESILASATSLHTILAAYNDLAGRLAYLASVCGDSPPGVAPDDSDDEVDIPF